MGRASESISEPVFGTGSQCLHSTEDAGERCSGGPSRGKGGTGAIESFLRNTEGALKPESVSTKQGRIAMLPSVHSAICGRVWADESPLAGGRNGCPKNRMPYVAPANMWRPDSSTEEDRRPSAT